VFKYIINDKDIRAAHQALASVLLEWTKRGEGAFLSVVNMIYFLFSYGRGKTYTGDGFRKALRLFGQRRGNGNGKVIILITDGEPNPANQSPCEDEIVQGLIDDEITVIILGNEKKQKHFFFKSCLHLTKNNGNSLQNNLCIFIKNN
jgi:uncharacterized protein YegL